VAGYAWGKHAARIRDRFDYVGTAARKRWQDEQMALFSKAAGSQSGLDAPAGLAKTELICYEVDADLSLGAFHSARRRMIRGGCWTTISHRCS